MSTDYLGDEYRQFTLESGHIAYIHKSVIDPSYETKN